MQFPENVLFMGDLDLPVLFNELRRLGPGEHRNRLKHEGKIARVVALGKGLGTGKGFFINVGLDGNRYPPRQIGHIHPNVLKFPQGT